MLGYEGVDTSIGYDCVSIAVDEDVRLGEHNEGISEVRSNVWSRWIIRDGWHRARHCESGDV